MIRIDKGQRYLSAQPLFPSTPPSTTLLPLFSQFQLIKLCCVSQPNSVTANRRVINVINLIKEMPSPDSLSLYVCACVYMYVSVCDGESYVIGEFVIQSS